MYHVEYTPQALKTLKKLDPYISKMLVAWIRKNVDGSENPRLHGKGLEANHSGKWRYRVGDYRIVVNISEETVTVLVLAIGHRKDIYN